MTTLSLSFRTPIIVLIAMITANFSVPAGAQTAPSQDDLHVPEQSPANARSFGERLSDAAITRTRSRVTYDPSYVRLGYPGGDVPKDRGVCADVVIRVLRTENIDLQKLVHQDMRKAFASYPALWGLSNPDRNIDHRRVPNLEKYLTRQGARLPASQQPEDYMPGDIVAWNLRGDAGFQPHIGVVTDKKGTSGWPLVVHNIGAGPRLEDVLFAWPMTGRYRLAPVE